MRMYGTKVNAAYGGQISVEISATYLNDRPQPFFVFVVRDGRARRQEVKLGLRLPGEVEIREGLNAGEPVVVRGIQRLRNDLPVRVVETLTRPTS
jgi:multidrug efflux pump subunit AcrA (membrane-fusion protein)